MSPSDHVLPNQRISRIADIVIVGFSIAVIALALGTMWRTSPSDVATAIQREEQAAKDFENQLAEMQQATEAFQKMQSGSQPLEEMRIGCLSDGRQTMLPKYTEEDLRKELAFADKYSKKNLGFLISMLQQAKQEALYAEQMRLCLDRKCTLDDPYSRTSALEADKWEKIFSLAEIAQLPPQPQGDYLSKVSDGASKLMQIPLEQVGNPSFYFRVLPDDTPYRALSILLKRNPECVEDVRRWLNRQKPDATQSAMLANAIAKSDYAHLDARWTVENVAKFAGPEQLSVLEQWAENPGFDGHAQSIVSALARLKSDKLGSIITARMDDRKWCETAAPALLGSPQIVEAVVQTLAAATPRASHIPILARLGPSLTGADSTWYEAYADRAKQQKPVDPELFQALTEMVKRYKKGA